MTTYLYDDFGQMLRQTSPVTGETSYEYDDGGSLVRSVDARGAVTTRSVDALGRVTQTVMTGEGSSETITWGYDSGVFGVGRMTSMTDGLGTVTYTYDRRGLLLTETRPIEGTSYVTKYAYDANGNRTKVTYPSARVVDTTQKGSQLLISFREQRSREPGSLPHADLGVSVANSSFFCVDDVHAGSVGGVTGTTADGSPPDDPCRPRC